MDATTKQSPGFRPVGELDVLMAELGRHEETLEQARIQRGRSDAEQRAVVAGLDLVGLLARRQAKDPSVRDEDLDSALAAALLQLLGLALTRTSEVAQEVSWQAAAVRRLLAAPGRRP